MGQDQEEEVVEERGREEDTELETPVLPPTVSHLMRKTLK